MVGGGEPWRYSNHSAVGKKVAQPGLEKETGALTAGPVVIPDKMLGFAEHVQPYQEVALLGLGRQKKRKNQ
jgi:hypothetical protein